MSLVGFPGKGHIYEMKLLISMKDFITKDLSTLCLFYFRKKFEELPTIIVIVFTACCFLQDLYMGSCVIFNRSIGFCMVFTAALKIRRFCVFRSILFILNLIVTCTVLVAFNL